MAYCTVQEVAAALRDPRLATTQTATLQACIDAAAIEIDEAADRPADDLLPPDHPLAKQINILRAVQWFKSSDAAVGGGFGFSETGALQMPASSFAQFASDLVPVKVGFGIA